MSFGPVKRRAPGSTASLVAKAFHAAGDVKAVAFHLNRGKSVVYSYTDDGPDGAQIKLDDARRLAAADADAAALFAEDFAAFAGGAFLAITSECHAKLGELMAKEEKAHGKAVALLLRRIGQAAELEPKERDELRDDILEMMRPLGAALRLLSEEAK